MLIFIENYHFLTKLVVWLKKKSDDLGIYQIVFIGDIPNATAEDVEIAVSAARRALKRNKGRDWAATSGAHRAKYLRAIAAKV